MLNINSMVNKLGFWGRQNAPGLMIGGGLSFMLGGVILACIETMKMEEIVGEAQAEIEAIEDTLEKSETYTEEEAKSDKASVYLRTTGKTLVNYAPAIATEVLGTLLILKGANIYNNRYSIMSACAASAILDLKEYRDRTIERFGEDVDRELRYGIKSEEIKEKITDENGKTKVVKKTLKLTDGDEEVRPYDYRRTFDHHNPYWDKDMDCNLFFIRSQQSMFNDKLKVEHHVFLNDVLQALGFQPTRAGQEVGWNYDPDNPSIDNFVDFGIYVTDEVERIPIGDGEFQETRNRVVKLDFNVDGSIINKVQWRAV